MAYILDLSSDEGKTLSDISADQAMVIVDPATNRLALLAKDSAGDSISTYFRASKRYVANLTQTSTGAPTATVLETDFGAATLTWARSSAGVYTCTANSAIFTSAKTVVLVGTPIPVNDMATIKVVLTSTTVITITCQDYKTSDDTSAPLDAMLTNTAFIIEVFP